jgi:hypothetical protein
MCSSLLLISFSVFCLLFNLLTLLLSRVRLFHPPREAPLFRWCGLEAMWDGFLPPPLPLPCHRSLVLFIVYFSPKIKAQLLPFHHSWTADPCRRVTICMPLAPHPLPMHRARIYNGFQIWLSPSSM